MDYTYYGTLEEANEYFDHRLHTYAWEDSDTAKREKALWAARMIIDTLNYKGVKAAVYALGEDASEEDIRAADASQEKEFPRGSDTEVPDAIKMAGFEIAYSLLDGKDPERELENLGVSSRAISSVRTTYSRGQVPIEHLINGVPNSLAWRLIRPFLQDDLKIRVTRVS